MRSLQRQIGDAWLATTETDTTLCGEHGLEAEAETVAISVTFAAVAIRVLDLEVFGEEYPRGSPNDMLSSAYEAHRESDQLGRAVSGLVVIRNAEVHLPAVIDPDINRVVRVPFKEGDRYRVSPVWKPHAELPEVVRDNTRTNRRHHDAYRTHVQGRFVIETLLDALAFFLCCDPALARMTNEGELEHFPLPEIAQHDYERRHPDWPSRSQVELDLRAELTRKPPSGVERTILHRLVTEGGHVEAYVGDTLIEPERWAAFTESSDQVVRDLTMGYHYKVGEARLSVAADGTAMLGDTPLHECLLPSAPAEGVHGGPDRSEAAWKGWFRLASDDAFYYRRQREGS